MLHAMSQLELPKAFIEAWLCAGRHIDRRSQGEISWLRSNLHQPLIHHLSFRIGNRLFFVFVVVQDGLEWGGGLRQLFLDAAETSDAMPCLFPVVVEGENYVPAFGGWGLQHAVTGEAVDPPATVTDELIEMNEWEVHDFAIQVVRNHLTSEGREIAQWQSTLTIHPSMWLAEGGKPSWVIVQAARFPASTVECPQSAYDFGRQFGSDGFFAPVIVAHGNQFSGTEEFLKLYRGHPLRASFSGLQPIAAGGPSRPIKAD